MKGIALRIGLLAVLCVIPAHSALAAFSNVECRDFYGYVMVSGYTNIAGNQFSNNAPISVSCNNLSNANGDKNVAAAVLEWEPNVGYGVGVVRVSNGSGGTMQGITYDSSSWAAGFWSDQIYGNSTIAELIVDNAGTMNGQAPNSTGDAFGFHNYNLYGGMNFTNESGATCSATAKGTAEGIDSWCYYGPINFLNNGTATGVSSGFSGGEVDPRGIFLYTYDSTNRAPIYCENNGYISSTATGGQTNYSYGAWVWAQGGNMKLINRGTIKGTSWGGAMGQAVGVYCGSNIGDDWVVNTGQMIGEGGPGWALGIENDDNNNWLGHIYVLNSGVISNGVTSGQACCGIYGGMGMLLWVSSGPTYITNTASGKIYGGNMGIWAGVYGGPITIYNYGDIYGGGGEAFHLGSGNDNVYMNGLPTITGTMNGGNGNNSLIFNLTGTLQYVNGSPANNGGNLSNYGLGTSGSIVVSGKTYSWANFNVSGTATAALPPPAGLTATSASSSQINLAWGAVTNATSYNIKRSTTDGGPYIVVASVVTATNYSDSGLAGGTIYYYVVSAVISGNESANSAQATATTLSPIVGSLAHRYSLSETNGITIADSIGGPVWNGTLPNGGTFSNGVLILSSGFSQYANLPAGIVSSLTNFTIMAWVNLNSTANWNRIFDFGNNTTTYMFLTPQNGANGTLRFAMTTNSNGGEQQINCASTLSTGGWHQVVVTLNTNRGILYLDGVALGTNTSMTLNPAMLGVTTNNYLGKSQWPDPYFNGLFDEFRIYNVGLSSVEIAATTALGSGGLLDGSSPPVSLTRTGTNLTLLWPLADTGFTVQSRTNLVLGGWMDVTSSAPQIVGGQWQVTLPQSIDSSKFYRLVK